jgi:uncharacterized integral membrane protein
MRATFSKVEEMADHVKAYVNNRITSVKLSAAEKTSRVAANIIAAVIVTVIFLVFIVFASIAAAYALAKWTGEFYWGFLIIAGVYLVAALFIWKLKERILQLPIMNALLRQLFKEEDNED